MAAAPGRVRSLLRPPSLGAAVGSLVGVAGLIVGMRPLQDNSFFTHLATGRIILDSGSVPSTDPYTFTARGADWLVQSWLASVLYASAEALGGANGLRLVLGVTAAAVALAGWRLTRPTATVVPRLAIGVLFVTVGAELWAERPLMLGLLAMTAAVLAARGELDPRWLVPIGWVWVNVHGSFPLGLVYLIVVWVGARLDGGDAGHERRALGWLAVGVAVGSVGPLGVGALSFPVELLQRQDVLQEVIEWRSPSFTSLSQRAFLVQLVLLMVALVRRPSYRSALVAAVFSAAALLGARNIVVASLVVLPILGEAAPAWGALRSGARSRAAAMVALAALVAALVLVSVRLDQRPFELRGYPIDAFAFLAEHEVDLSERRLASVDIVGNLQELIHGPTGDVFYDDRFDMFPDAVSEAHLALVRSSPALRRELNEFDIDLVLWQRTSGTGQRLIADEAWRVLYSDQRWVLVCERGVELGASLGRC